MFPEEEFNEEMLREIMELLLLYYNSENNTTFIGKLFMSRVSRSCFCILFTQLPCYLLGSFTLSSPLGWTHLSQ